MQEKYIFSWVNSLRPYEYESENDMGKPIYCKHRCPKYAELVDKYQKKWDKLREDVIKENEELAKKGEPLKEVPDEKLDPYKLPPGLLYKFRNRVD